jgi:Calcium-activated chloride channel
MTGYIVMFAAAFPLAPLLAFMNNVIEIRTDAWKFLYAFNRPLYRGAGGIGIWYFILETVGFVAVVTNSLILALTTGTIVDWLGGNVVLAFGVAVAMEHALLVIKVVAAYLIPDYPKTVRRHLALQKYMQELLLRRVLQKNLLGDNSLWEEDDDEDDEDSSYDDEQDDGQLRFAEGFDEDDGNDDADDRPNDSVVSVPLVQDDDADDGLADSGEDPSVIP